MFYLTLLAPALKPESNKGTRCTRAFSSSAALLNCTETIILWLFWLLLIEDFNGVLCVDVARSAPDGGGRDNILHDC
jgi:hypothetical protein